MGVCSSLRGTRKSSQNRALVRSCRITTCYHTPRKCTADDEFVDSNTLLAHPWGSAVHCGRPASRVRIALSFGAVGSNTCDHPPRKCTVDAEFVDSITPLTPPRGSAVHFGVSITIHTRTLNLPTISHIWLPHGVCVDRRFAPESRSRLELSVQSQW